MVRAIPTTYFPDCQAVRLPAKKQAGIEGSRNFAKIPVDRKTRTIQFVGRTAPRRVAPHRVNTIYLRARGEIHGTQAMLEN